MLSTDTKLCDFCEALDASYETYVTSAESWLRIDMGEDDDFGTEDAAESMDDDGQEEEEASDLDSGEEEDEDYLPTDDEVDHEWTRACQSAKLDFFRAKAMFHNMQDQALCYDDARRPYVCRDGERLFPNNQRAFMGLTSMFVQQQPATARARRVRFSVDQEHQHRPESEYRDAHKYWRTDGAYERGCWADTTDGGFWNTSNPALDSLYSEQLYESLFPRDS